MKTRFRLIIAVTALIFDVCFLVSAVDISQHQVVTAAVTEVKYHGRSRNAQTVTVTYRCGNEDYTGSFTDRGAFMKSRSVGDSIELKVSSRDPERILRPGVTIALGIFAVLFDLFAFISGKPAKKHDNMDGEIYGR